MILPALLSGTEHPSKRFTSLLKRIVKKIRKCFPSIRIIIRADAGFSCSEFYQLADEYDLKYCIGLSSNSVLKQLLDPEIQWVRENYLKKGLKYQHIVGAYGYKAKSWEHFQKVYAKVESTGKGMNTRIFVSNLEDQTGEQIYYDFYTHRGETCENRIKEIKNMCYSDRLSCHRFSANYFRLMLSALVYEFFRLIKKLIARTKYDQAKKWLVNNIRLFILKVGAIVSERKRYINIKFSKAYARQNLFRQLIELS